jgi:hypothetical protein
MIDAGRGAEQDHAVLCAELRRRLCHGRSLVACEIMLALQSRNDFAKRSIPRLRSHSAIVAAAGSGIASRA